MTDVNDVVLLHIDEKPAAFARIERIEPDQKPGWYHVTLLLLQIPLQTVTWILRDGYIEGEPYTMGGRPMRLEPVVAPGPGDQPGTKIEPDGTLVPTYDTKAATTKKTGTAKVISFNDLKKS
jgi:hypothetical protein